MREVSAVIAISCSDMERLKKNRRRMQISTALEKIFYSLFAAGDFQFSEGPR
jgi:hypothetical protein